MTQTVAHSSDLDMSFRPHLSFNNTNLMVMGKLLQLYLTYGLGPHPVVVSHFT